MDRGCRRENGQCGTGQQLEKWTRHGVAFNYPYLQWGLLCNWTTQPAVPYAIQLQAWEQLGDNCQEKSNKHFFTDKRIGDKRQALPRYRYKYFTLSVDEMSQTDKRML